MTLIDSRSFGPKQDRCAHSSSIGRERGFCKQDTCRALPLAGVHRQLRGESALVSGARFAARDVGGQVRELIKQARRLQPLQHVHHHQVAGAERPVEPVGLAEASGELLQRTALAIRDLRQTLLGPGLVVFQQLGVCEFEDRRLHRFERSKHPRDRARPRVGIVRQQAGMALGNAQDDRPRLE